MNTSILDRCSYFLEEKGLFGGYPKQEDIPVLESIGVRVFVDLTMQCEKGTTQYVTNYSSLRYPIVDKNVPSGILADFYEFIRSIVGIIKTLSEGEKVYIHCKGGHGRSGLVVACILCLYYGINADDALHTTYHCHQKRKVMRDVWRNIGSPQTTQQKKFVHLFYNTFLCNKK